MAIFLGRNALPIDSFNDPQAQELLPGKLLRQARRPDGDLYLAPRDYPAPDPRGLPRPGRRDPLGRLSRVPLLATRTSLPAGVRRRCCRTATAGRRSWSGRRAGPRADDDHAGLRPARIRTPWNLLPVGEAWPFLILANQMAAYLVGSSDQQLNYFAGQTAVLQLDAAAQRRELPALCARRV